MAITARRQLRYPTGPDPANVPLHIQNLATDLDNFSPGNQGTMAARPAPTPGPGNILGVPGSIYYATDTGTLSVSDGVTWHCIVQAGEIRPTARAAMPAGWLLCNGASVLRTDYPALFSALGGTSSPYGLPDGTHFNLPDLRGRVPVGEDGAAARMTVNDAMGQFGGEELHILTAAEAAQKAVTTNNDSPAHTHSLQALPLTNWTATHYAYATAAGPAEIGLQNPDTGGPNVPHQHTISGSAAASPGHNNMPPYQIVNYMIKT